MIRTARIAAASLLTLATLLVAGCQPDDGPTEPPTTDPSSSVESTEPATTEPATEEPTVEPPPDIEAPTPDEAVLTDDHRGAIMAVRYFLDLYTYMRATGDTAAFEAMSAPECSFCSGAVENAAEFTTDGGWAEGGALVFDVAEATANYPTDEEPNYIVRFEMSQESQVIHWADGTLETSEPDDFRVAVATRFVNGRFIVFGLNFQ